MTMTAYLHFHPTTIELADDRDLAPVTIFLAANGDPDFVIRKLREARQYAYHHESANYSAGFVAAVLTPHRGDATAAGLVRIIAGESDKTNGGAAYRYDIQFNGEAVVASYDNGHKTDIIIDSLTGEPRPAQIAGSFLHEN